MCCVRISRLDGANAQTVIEPMLQPMHLTFRPRIRAASARTAVVAVIPMHGYCIG